MESLSLIASIGILKLLAAVNGNMAGQYDQCPSWTIPVNTTEGNITCECGDDIGGVVSCDNSTKQVFVQTCYCVTQGLNAEGFTNNSLVVGACPYSCFYHTTIGSMNNFEYYLLPRDKSKVTDMVCGYWNRTEHLCSQCKKGFAPSILTYDLGCIECNTTDSTTGWVKFIAAGLLPPTAFFILIIILRLSVNSPKLVGFILFAQWVSASPSVYYTGNVLAHYSTFTSNSVNTMVAILWVFYGVFNLDFFYTVLPLFCVPGIDTHGKLGLQFLIAVHPLLLTLLTYILFELHARDVKIVVYLWKPFHKCFVRFRREGNIQTTIIDAFATIFHLSYVKILIACTNFIAITNVYNVTGDFICTAYPYMSARKCTYRKNPLSLFVTILGLSIILNVMILPVLLMLLYPMRCFRKCLGKLCCCRGRTYLMLQTFMDCFLGYYKDGTNGTRDCRYVAGFYFILRLVLCFLYAFSIHQKPSLQLASGMLVASALFIALIQPYKNKCKVNNITDPLFLFLGGLFGVSVDWLINGFNEHSTSLIIACYMIIVLTLTLPLIYLATITLIHLHHMALVQQTVKVTKRVWQRFKGCANMKSESQELIAPTEATPIYGVTDN